MPALPANPDMDMLPQWLMDEFPYPADMALVALPEDHIPVVAVASASTDVIAVASASTDVVAVASANTTEMKPNIDPSLEDDDDEAETGTAFIRH